MMADALSRTNEHSINFFGIDIVWEEEQVKDEELHNVVKALSEGCMNHIVLPDWWMRCYLKKDILMIDIDDKVFSTLKLKR